MPESVRVDVASYNPVHDFLSGVDVGVLIVGGETKTEAFR
jgi:hypothetical protein